LLFPFQSLCMVLRLPFPFLNSTPWQDIRICTLQIFLLFFLKLVVNDVYLIVVSLLILNILRRVDLLEVGVKVNCDSLLHIYWRSFFVRQGRTLVFN
jgi:hypothetical protein